MAVGTIVGPVGVAEDVVVEDFRVVMVLVVEDFVDEADVEDLMEDVDVDDFVVEVEDLVEEVDVEAFVEEVELDDFDVDDDVLLVDNVLVESFEVEELTLLLLPSTYTLNRFPLPQYSYWSPPHSILQSVAGAATEPSEKLFPQ